MSTSRATLDHTGAMPDAKFFGIPRYQPFSGGRTFDYEQKYPLDPQGKEARPEARVWATYLDEAEMYDHDMIQSFRDTIDSLLVLAGLFSAIVATFVAQTSQSLKPDFTQLNLLIQIEQTALLRTGGNVSAMNNIPISNIATDTRTYTTADLWINGLFFTSLSLSVSTALLAVLVKQWCQAYTSVTSGSARDRVLTRQFRFDGLIKWKLPEIVGSFPLLLHLAFAVFFAGLSYFVYDLHRNISSIVIVCTVLAAFLYFGSILLPAIWLECPYRIPLLFRPARSLIYFFGKLFSFLGSNGSSILSILYPHLPPEKLKMNDILVDILVSLKEAESALLSAPDLPYDDFLSQRMLITARSLVWLFELSNNMATQRIATAAAYGSFIEHWDLIPNYPLYPSMRLDARPSLRSFFPSIPLAMVEVAFESARDTAHNVTPADSATRSSLKTWIDFIDIMYQCSKNFSGAPPIPITQDKLNSTLNNLMFRIAGQDDLKDALLRWGADTHWHTPQGGFFHTAICAKSLDNVRWLINRHLPVDDPVSRYGSPLMTACYHGFVDAVKLLIKNGADVNKITEGNFFTKGASTALTMSIAGRWKPEIGAYLLDNGAQINEMFVVDGEPITALQFAAQFGSLGAVCFLLERGATFTPKIKDTLHRLDWIGGSGLKKAGIEGMLREHASRTIRLHCLPESQLGPVLTQKYLA
ncbi:hypothetical protein DL96DRAFT_1821895 [Flagelloscypha sp. PMI_526]|nr:hypothetical protein DL96DRAFT_1821895 [Flagelloscypha sp. PMI_526]